MLLDAHRVLGRAEPMLDGIGEGEPHADGDGLAVQQPVGIAGEGFQRMAEGVTEIEQRAPAALLALVGDDDLGLGAGARLHGVAALAVVTGEHIAPILLEPGEEGRIAEEPVFRHLGIAGAELALAQGRQHRDVGEHQARLMEGADQILALLGVDAGLAADGGVHLGEERGRHLHHAHAAAQDRGGEAGQVAHHAAAKGDDAIAALDAEIEQGLAELGQHGKAFGRLARRHHGGAEEAALPLEARLERRQMQGRDIRVADHRVARAGQGRGEALARRGEEVLADDDVVTPPGQVHGDGRLAVGFVALGLAERGCVVAHHRPPLRRAAGALFAVMQPSLAASASTTAPTMTSWGTSRLSTVMSASA